MDLVAYIILAVAVGAVVWRIVRRIRHKSADCCCGDHSSCDTNNCAGCPLSEKCNKKSS